MLLGQHQICVPGAMLLSYGGMGAMGASPGDPGAIRADKGRF